jgi:hypothetical protein
MIRRANPPFYRSPRPAPAHPVSLSDGQLLRVMIASGPLEPEKRTLALERIAARLTLLAVFTDSDVEAAIAGALVGLIHVREPAQPR